MFNQKGLTDKNLDEKTWKLDLNLWIGQNLGEKDLIGENLGQQ